MRQRAEVLDHLTEIAAVDPTTARVHSACVVRDVGRLGDQLGSDSSVRYRLRARRHDGTTGVAAALYAAPAITMLALHAAVGNHYTRYNLILIGPYAVGAVLIVTLYWRQRRA
jgi:hypothetical protein